MPDHVQCGYHTCFYRVAMAWGKVVSYLGDMFKVLSQKGLSSPMAQGMLKT